VNQFFFLKKILINTKYFNFYFYCLHQVLGTIVGAPVSMYAEWRIQPSELSDKELCEVLQRLGFNVGPQNALAWDVFEALVRLQRK
jgi:hypothetical protein